MIFRFVAVIVALIVVTTKIVAAGTPDLNGNGKVDIFDFNILISSFGSSDSTKIAQADVNSDNKIDILDFNSLIVNFGKNVATPSVAPSPSTPTQTPPPAPVGASSGIWLSSAEIMRLPMSGSAWEAIVSTANRSWGSACLYDNNCGHDTDTMAGALVAKRTDNQAMRNKVISALQSAMGSRLERALELSRGLQSYVIAADIIGYHDPAFENWVREMLNADITGHSGKGILGTAYNSSNNWGGHARASVAAAAIYLNDNAMLQKVTTAHKAFIGLPAPGNTMVYSGTTWHADPSNKAGINRKNAVVNGKNISGAMPEDWRRASTNFVWPPATTGYMWEGIQGYIVTAVILHRAGLVPINAADNSIMRVMDALYGKGEAAGNSPAYVNPAASDDTWVPWIVNYYLGENRYPTQAANPGKGVGFTDWTHAR